MGNAANKNKANSANPNIFYDEAIIASEPQIIRPNVSNLTMVPNNNRTKKQKNPNNTNKRNNQQQNNANNGHWPRGQTANSHNVRGRGFRNANYRNKQSSNPFENSNGYKSFRTSSSQNGYRNQWNVNNSPYQRPTQKPKVRQLPSYNNYSNDVYHRAQHNGFNRNYLQNKRQNYNKNRNQRNNNNFNRNNQRFNNNGNKNKKQYFNKNNNYNNNHFNNKRERKSFKKPDAASLDKELEEYLMKNPNVEDRKNTLNANLDKDLDDYFNSAHSENNGAANKQ